MHGALIVDLEVEVEDRVQILVVDRLAARLVVRLRFLCIDLHQAFALTFKCDARPDDSLRVLLPHGVIKWCGICIGRSNLLCGRHILYAQRKHAFLGAKLHETFIGGVCREYLRDSKKSNIALFGSMLFFGSEEHEEQENQQQRRSPRKNLPAPCVPKFAHTPVSSRAFL